MCRGRYVPQTTRSWAWPYVLALFAGALVGVAGTGLAQGDENKTRRPNVLFLLTDDQRPDTICALGNEHIDTPNLDALVRRGMAFSQAMAPYPHCGPSREEIATGCHRFRIRRDLSRNKGKLTLPTWAQTMRRAGYRTWYVGKWDGFGTARGFGFEETQAYFVKRAGELPPDKRRLVVEQDWKGRKVTAFTARVFQTNDGRLLAEKGVGITPTISEDFADGVIRLINRKPKEPFFLQVGFSAPHDPLLMPPGYEDKYAAEKIPLPPNFRPQHPFDHGCLGNRDEVALLPAPRTADAVRAELAMYYAVISHLDEQIGRIVEALKTSGQLDTTLIIFSSDQGLALGSHGLMGKDNMYEHTVGVPLIFAGPGIPAGRRGNAQCYLRDLYPTVCELVGIEIPQSVRGRSLVPVLRGQTDSVHPFVVGYWGSVQRMIRTQSWKLIHYPKIGKLQLFDLTSDPYELENLAEHPHYHHVVAQLRGKLRAWQQEAGDPHERARETAEAWRRGPVGASPGPLVFRDGGGCRGGFLWDDIGSVRASAEQCAGP